MSKTLRYTVRYEYYGTHQDSYTISGVDDFWLDHRTKILTVYDTINNLRCPVAEVTHVIEAGFVS